MWVKLVERCILIVQKASSGMNEAFCPFSHAFDAVLPTVAITIMHGKLYPLEFASWTTRLWEVDGYCSDHNDRLSFYGPDCGLHVT